MGSWFKWRALIVVGSVLIFCLMPALLLWYLGYLARVSWNDDSIKTTCTIIGHSVKQGICTETCNCYYTTSHTSCATCEYICYDGLALTTYKTEDGTAYNKTFTLVDNYRSEANAEEKLDGKYPIGDKINCYYERNDPTDIRTGHKGTRVFLAFFCVFIIIGGLVLLGWIGIESYLFYKDNY